MTGAKRSRKIIKQSPRGAALSLENENSYEQFPFPLQREWLIYENHG
jgi:hypothetical protein